MASEAQQIAAARILIGCLSLLANATNLSIMAPMPGYNTHRMLVKHLTFSDMLVGMLGMIFGLVDVYSTSHHPCSFVLVLCVRAAILASMFLVVVMATEHFTAIFKPHAYRATFTRRKMTVLVVFTWILSVMIQFSRLPEALAIHHHLTIGRNRTSIQNGTQNLTEDDVLFCDVYQNEAYHVDYCILFVITCACLVVVIFIYSYIAANARRRLARPGRHGNRGAPEASGRHRKLMKTTFLVLLTFVFCWTPVCCMLFIRSISRSATYREMRLHDSVASALPYVNSLCDPIIYSLRMREVRQGYRHALEACRAGKRCKGQALGSVTA